MKDIINKIWARITKDCRAPFNPYAANFGYIDKDGTYFAGYMTRGGEMRYEKKGVPAKYDEPEYWGLYNRGKTNPKTGTVTTISTEAIYKEKNQTTKKYRYYVGCCHSKRYIDAQLFEDTEGVVIRFI